MCPPLNRISVHLVALLKTVQVHSQFLWAANCVHLTVRLPAPSEVCLCGSSWYSTLLCVWLCDTSKCGRFECGTQCDTAKCGRFECAAISALARPNHHPHSTATPWWGSKFWSNYLRQNLCHNHNQKWLKKTVIFYETQSLLKWYYWSKLKCVTVCQGNKSGEKWKLWLPIWIVLASVWPSYFLGWFPLVLSVKFSFAWIGDFSCNRFGGRPSVSVLFCHSVVLVWFGLDWLVWFSKFGLVLSRDLVGNK